MYLTLSNGDKITITSYYQGDSPYDFLRFSANVQDVGMSIDELKTELETYGNEIKLFDDDGTQLHSAWEGFTVVKEIQFINPDDDTVPDYYDITIKQPPIKYATQGDIDLLADAIADMSEVVYGDIVDELNMVEDAIADMSEMVYGGNE